MLDDLHGVIDAQSFKPRVLDSKSGRIATERLSQRSDDVAIALLAAPHFLFLWDERWCYKTNGAGKLALTLARKLATLETYATSRSTTNVSDMLLFLYAHFLFQIHCISILLAAARRMLFT